MNTQNLNEQAIIEEFETTSKRIGFLMNKVKEYAMVIDLGEDEGWERKYLDKYRLELQELNGGII